MNRNPYAPSTGADDGTRSRDDSSAERDTEPIWVAVPLLFFGAIGFLLGVGWIRTFGFTNYRAHLAHIGLPLGIVTLIVSLLFLACGVTLIRARMNDGNERMRRDADVENSD